MKQYLDMLQHIKTHGVMKENRTGVSTKTVSGLLFEHDLREGFPLLTTKPMPKKSMAAELECFIRGVTSKRTFQNKGCKFWDQWCNPWAMRNVDRLNSQAYKEAQLATDDLGPIYGYQWRNFNEQYLHGQPVLNCVEERPALYNKKADQLLKVINTLKSNPNDRRMVVSAWNFLQIEDMALPACHVLWNLVHVNGVLHLNWIQRSCDMLLGVPVNIASYALLLALLARSNGMTAGWVKGLLCDAHIYEDQFDAVDIQLSRTPKTLPVLILNELSEVLGWDYRDVDYDGYCPNDPLPKVDVAV